MTLDKLLKNQSPSILLMILAFNVAILLCVVFVTLDSRERGATKTASTLWALSVGLFPPLVFVYLIVKMLAGARAQTVLKMPEQASPIKNCPYCGGAVGGDEKLCRKCGRLL